MENNAHVDSTSAVTAIDSILSIAADLRASDIHIDPRLTDIMIRLRIDGQISEYAVLTKSIHEEIIARLKVLSGVRTDIHAVPQDGRWRTDIRGEFFNIRISFMPTYHGENAVIRLLPARVDRELSLGRLGFTPDHAVAIHRALKRTHGLILVTGPTGSGKTTTLHACLSQKSFEKLSIITLEDPVEYEISGVRQVHIKHTHGVTFASGLRSALRQDPDVIMVGEIRDAETASVVIHTALTGHLVLSTLHTNSATEAIPRLIDMGIDRYLLASTLKLVIAQRLIRTVCHNCSGDGCDQCRFSGYSGRSVIAEVCEIDAGLQVKDFIPLIGDGHEKVEWGITTREEVMRVLYT